MSQFKYFCFILIVFQMNNFAKSDENNSSLKNKLNEVQLENADLHVEIANLQKENVHLRQKLEAFEENLESLICSLNSECFNEIFNSAKATQKDSVNTETNKADKGNINDNENNQNKLPETCADKRIKQGINQIQLATGDQFTVVCDLETRGGGWTVIQRRVDDTVDFYRPWTDYKNGFGDLNGSFWLGLDPIHELTSHVPHELLIVLEDFENVTKYAHYEEIKVASEIDKYRLTLGAYSGDAGNSLVDDSGNKFTTYDRDNDDNDGNCAESFKGAWWFSVNCSYSNLNGLYKRGQVDLDFYKQIVYWYDLYGYTYSLKYVQIMIRPKISA